LELNIFKLENDKYRNIEDSELVDKINDIDDERLFILAEAIRRGISIEVINKKNKSRLFFFR